MNITKEEKMMYKIMKALYESGIPISFKGSMVLRAFLFESGYKENTRHTIDIDGDWISDSDPNIDMIIKSFKKALKRVEMNLDLRLYRMYDKGKSAGFEFFDLNTNEILFTMDIDVNKPYISTKIYEIDDLHFSGATPSQMIADKTYVLSTDKIFRRIKDLVDLYYISKVFVFNKEEVYSILEKSGRELGDFDAFKNRYDELKHSYDKFRFSFDVHKPDFDDVYQTVKKYVSVFVN